MGLIFSSRLEKMKKAFRAGEYDKALTYAEKIPYENVTTAYDLSMLAEVYIAKNRLKEAKDIYIEMYRRNKSIGTCKDTIRICIKNKSVKQAIHYIKELANLDPDDYERFVFQYQVGRILKQPDDYLIACLRKVREADYIDVWALELAKLYYKNGMKQECMAECRSIKLWFPDTAFSEKADVLVKSCRRDVPVAEVSKLLKKIDDEWRLRERLANRHKKTGPRPTQKTREEVKKSDILAEREARALAAEDKDVNIKPVSLKQLDDDRYNVDIKAYMDTEETEESYTVEGIDSFADIDEEEEVMVSQPETVEENNAPAEEDQLEDPDKDVFEDATPQTAVNREYEGEVEFFNEETVGEETEASEEVEVSEEAEVADEEPVEEITEAEEISEAEEVADTEEDFDEDDLEDEEERALREAYYKKLAEAKALEEAQASEVEEETAEEQLFIDDTIEEVEEELTEDDIEDEEERALREAYYKKLAEAKALEEAEAKEELEEVTEEFEEEIQEEEDYSDYEDDEEELALREAYYKKLAALQAMEETTEEVAEEAIEEADEEVYEEAIPEEAEEAYEEKEPASIEMQEFSFDDDDLMIQDISESIKNIMDEEILVDEKEDIAKTLINDDLTADVLKALNSDDNSDIDEKVLKMILEDK